MKKTQDQRRNIILIDNDRTTRTALSILFEEMGVNVHQLDELEDGKKIIKSALHDLLIVDLDFPGYKGIELTKAFIAEHPRSEIIALCNKVTSAVYTRMRMLGIFRVLERPVKIQDFRDLVLRALASNRTVRMMSEKSTISLEIANHLQFLLTLGEQNFFEQILEICLSEGHEIDLAQSPEDFISMVQKGFYDVIFSSHEFLLSIHPREMDSILQDPIKPVLFLIHSDQLADMSRIEPRFSSIVHLPQGAKRSVLLDNLQKQLPDYIQMRNRIYTSLARQEEKKSRSISVLEPVRAMARLFGKRVILFYLALIIIAALLGFFVNQLSERKETRQPVNQSEFIQDMEKYLELKRQMEQR